MLRAFIYGPADTAPNTDNAHPFSAQIITQRVYSYGSFQHSVLMLTKHEGFLGFFDSIFFLISHCFRSPRKDWGSRFPLGSHRTWQSWSEFAWTRIPGSDPLSSRSFPFWKKWGSEESRKMWLEGIEENNAIFLPFNWIWESHGPSSNLKK